MIEKQNRYLELAQNISGSSEKYDKSLYIAAFGGVAAGLTLALIGWLVSSIAVSDDAGMMRPGPSATIHASEIRETNENIDLLYKRVELITEAVSNLETKLTRMTSLTDGLVSHPKIHASSIYQEDSEPAVSMQNTHRSETYLNEEVRVDLGTGKSLVPTHSTNVRVNLRPSPSLDTTPITTLKAGSRVEYLSEAEGWYFVKTEFYGNGWCTSDYLSSLSKNNENIP